MRAGHCFTSLAASFNLLEVLEGTMSDDAHYGANQNHTVSDSVQNVYHK